MDNNPMVREAIEAIVDAQHRITHSMFRSSLPDWIQLDLTMGQLRALMALAGDGPMTVSALAERLAIAKPTASILIDRLVQAGDANRTEDSGDRRRTLVALTAAGEQLAERLRHGKSERFERWLAAMQPDDLAALTRGMRALAAVAERAEPADRDVLAISRGTPPSQRAAPPHGAPHHTTPHHAAPAHTAPARGRAHARGESLTRGE
jgi:DNA-binding MarR family transcriptional regulator